MAEVFTSDNSVPAEVMESMTADEAESLEIGEQIVAEQEARLAGKYKSTEELEAAYLELQKKLGNQEEESVEEQIEEQDEEFDDGGLYDILNAYRETGEISDEAIEAINNMSPGDVFALMADQQPSGREMSGEEISSVYEAVGGQESYQALTSWAAENLNENEINTYDSMIESGDMGQISFALQALYYRYTDAMGQDGNMLQGKPASAQSTYRSQQELIEAMNDPRYDSDPAYRQDVLSKLDRSELTF